MARTQTPPRGPRRRALRWAAGLLVVALVPKCLVCLAAYAALAAGLGTLGVEFCASPSPRGNGARLFALDIWSLAGLALAISIATVALLLARRRQSARVLGATTPSSRISPARDEGVASPTQPPRHVESRNRLPLRTVGQLER